ncbi:MAG: glycosyltransferase family 4 protein [Candidatus Nealsonbacteria bacterium]|nr:glycosyltransferase family 4 protein [Candidatus Nealsonbacteria bacterium]
MRIAISVLSAVGYGGKTYFQNIIPALARLDNENEYYIFISKGHPLISSIVKSNFIFYECLGKNQSPAKRFFWEQFVFPRKIKKCKIDVLFTAKNLNVFFAPCKTIIAIRNTEPFRYREYKNNWKLDIISWIRWQLTKWSVRKAHRVIAVSQYVKDLLKERFPGIENKVEIAYNGNPVLQNPKSNVRTLNFILTASKFVSYANQLNLLRGYAEFLRRKPDAPSLWFAGDIHDKEYFRKTLYFVKRAGIESRVKFLGLIPQEQLLRLMRQAMAFVFPSTLEACPHTLIEAMACGVPIITSNFPPMPEICTDAAIYFNPKSPQDIADKIEKTLADKEARRHLSGAGLARVKFFTWDKTAEQLQKIFTKTHYENSSYNRQLLP